ncbi:hypothetical protein BD779DRAFT_1476552 [Infundibulicybe gibba]|nr:hypothetical protein BD779DRAFT_1476552 [Infundibulicybe gibba]
MPPRSSSSKSKRKARAVSDSSIEILGSPAPPSPPKKKLATSRTTPAGTDQPIYKAFPSSSGSVMSVPSPFLHMIFTYNPFNARAQLDAIFTESDAAKAPGGTRPPSSSPPEDIDNPSSPSEVTPQSDTAASPSTRLRKVTLATPVVSPKKIFKNVLPTGVATLPKAATSDTEQLSGNATNSSMPNKELTPDFVDVDAMDASAAGSDENNMSDDTSINPTGEQEDALSGESTDEFVDELPERLPILGPLRVIHAFGSSGNEPTERVSFTPLSKKLSDSANAIFLRGLTFDNHGFYINTSRANPSLLGVNARRVIMANSATNMVGIMLGMLTECFLYREHTSGSANKPYITHKVTILPLAQEFRRDTTVWGQVLNFHRIVASVSEDGISFHTRPKILGSESVASSPATPRKPRGGIYLTVNSSPAATSQNKSSGLTYTSYPGSRAFEDDSGREDILVESLVAVGYTLNTFGEKPQLSTNIQFLILLGVPV